MEKMEEAREQLRAVSRETGAWQGKKNQIQEALKGVLMW